MKWVRNNELPPWAYLVGGLSLAAGGWISVLTKHVWLGNSLVCVGIWLIRWWCEAPADHSRFQKLSERQFRICRSSMVVSSWVMLVATVARVCLSIFGVLT